MPQKKMLFVFNPKAGREEMRLNLYEVVDAFVGHGFEVTIHPTQGRHDAYEQVLGRAGGYPYLFCSGGDGTLNEVVDALMLLEKRPLLGYIPSGTTNDFASSLGLPRDVLHAAHALCEGKAVSIDIGSFQDEFFSYVAAFGLFTDVSYGTPQDMKNLLGHAAYMLEGVRRLASIESYRCTVRLDEEEFTDDFVFGMVSNSSSIGGFKMLTESATLLDDGLFEVLLLKTPQGFIDLQDVIASLINRELYTDLIIVRKAARISMQAHQKPIRWTLDGEDGGEHTQVHIQNHHRALRILVPKDR